jgi:hypothetical protein
MLGPQPGGRVRGRPVVGEGVETTLAARQLGLRPAWAMGGLGAIGRLPVLGGVGYLTVLGETGKARTARRELPKAYSAGRRWATARARSKYAVAFAASGSRPGPRRRAMAAGCEPTAP